MQPCAGSGGLCFQPRRCTALRLLRLADSLQMLCDDARRCQPIAVFSTLIETCDRPASFELTVEERRLFPLPLVSNSSSYRDRSPPLPPIANGIDCWNPKATALPAAPMASLVPNASPSTACTVQRAIFLCDTVTQSSVDSLNASPHNRDLL